MIAAGFTTTLTVKAAPVHVPAVAVTLYVAVTADVVVLVRSSFTVLRPDSAPALPLKPVPDGADHAYVVPVGIIVPVGL